MFSHCPYCHQPQTNDSVECPVCGGVALRGGFAGPVEPFKEESTRNYVTSMQRKSKQPPKGL